MGVKRKKIDQRMQGAKLKKNKTSSGCSTRRKVSLLSNDGEGEEVVR